jgi:hypothetical protein
MADSDWLVPVRMDLELGPLDLEGYGQPRSARTRSFKCSVTDHRIKIEWTR